MDTEVQFCGPNGCGVKQDSNDDVFPLTIKNMNLGFKLQIDKAEKSLKPNKTKERKFQGFNTHTPTPDPIKIIPTCIGCEKLLVLVETTWEHKK